MIWLYQKYSIHKNYLRIRNNATNCARFSSSGSIWDYGLQQWPWWSTSQRWVTLIPLYSQPFLTSRVYEISFLHTARVVHLVILLRYPHTSQPHPHPRALTSTVRSYDFTQFESFRCTNDLCGIRDRCSEYEVMKRVDAMVNNQMVANGYDWILLDDCWSAHERDENGELQPDRCWKWSIWRENLSINFLIHKHTRNWIRAQFPRGMKSLADYVHRHGMKLGLYTCIGTETCKKNRPGSYGYYDKDANTLASWGVDMVKADYCNKPSNESGQDLYVCLRLISCIYLLTYILHRTTLFLF